MPIHNTLRQPRPEPSKCGGILSIVLIYAAFSACWILLSDKWVQMIFTDPKQIILASTLKGWFFVGITSLLLYGLMRRCIGVNAAPKVFPTGPRRLGWPFISLMASIIVFTGVGISQIFIHHIEEKVDQLQAVADLKIRQIADGTLLAKVDSGTVSDALWIGFVGLLALFVTGVGFYLIRQGQQLAVAQAVQQTQAERLNAQHLLSSIADSSDDAIFAKDLAGRYIFINRAGSQFVGKSAADILGQDDSAIFTPEQAETLMTLSRRVITENRTITMEEMLNTRDGERTFLATKGPLRDDEDNVIGVFGISRDITERKQAEAVLRESEELKQAILDSINAHIAVLDHQGIIVIVNRLWQNFAEKNSPQPDQLTMHVGVGMNYLEICRQSAGPFAEGAQEALDGIQAVLDGRLPCFSLEYPCHLPAQQRWFAMTVTSLGNGKQGVVIAHADITERRAAEEALRARERYQRAVLDNFPFMVWLKDTDSRILAANKTYARVANVADPDELIGKTDLDYWETELAEQYRAEDRAVLQSGQSKMTEDEITEVDRRFWIETYKSPVELDGHIIGTVGFARDITERKMAEAELIQRNNELERFNRATVGRELDMIALKQQVNELAHQLGQERPYVLDFLDARSSQQEEGGVP